MTWLTSASSCSKKVGASVSTLIDDWPAVCQFVCAFFLARFSSSFLQFLWNFFEILLFCYVLSNLIKLWKSTINLIPSQLFQSQHHSTPCEAIDLQNVSWPFHREYLKHFSPKFTIYILLMEVQRRNFSFKKGHFK